MNIQEQEEIDFSFGRQNDFQNALEVSRLFHRPQNATPIGNGPFQIIIEAPFYCHYTDALAGSYICQHLCFETENELKKKEAELFTEENFDPNCYYKIINPNKQEPKQEFEGIDDCPF